MNNQDFIKIWIEKTPMVSKDLQASLLRQALESDQKEAAKTEAERLKEFLRMKGMINE